LHAVPGISAVSVIIYVCRPRMITETTRTGVLEAQYRR
jgi:hypothetical protein